MKAVSHTQGYETAIKSLFKKKIKNARHRTSISVKVGQKVAGNELLIK